MNLKNLLKSNIKRHFPFESILEVFAYGSAVMPQKNHTPTMVDIIFIVSDINSFHSENLLKNDNHYSFISKLFGKTALEYINRKGTSVYYNPAIQLSNDNNEAIFLKYGIVHQEDFKYHLTNWDNLFLAGRFHKPVLKILENENCFLDDIISQNREAAFSLCALKNTEKISKIDFYKDLASLSYMGDIRTYIKAEKNDKILNSVIGALDEYDKIYMPFFKKYEISINENIISFVNQKNSLEKYYNNIPNLFINNLESYCKNKNDLNFDQLKITFLNEYSQSNRKYLIDSYIKSMNLKYSFYGILTAFYSTDIHKSVII